MIESKLTDFVKEQNDYFERFEMIHQFEKSLTFRQKVKLLFPDWLFSDIVFRFKNRWDRFKSGYIIFLGAEWTNCDKYSRFVNLKSLEISILNFSFEFILRGNPLIT